MRQTIDRLDYTTRDYEGFRNLMIQKLQELMPEYTDTRQSDAGIVILELNAMCLDILSYYLDSIANECFLVTAEQRSNIMKFCKMLGYTPRFATSAHYIQSFTKSDINATLTIPQGTKVKTYSSNPDNEVYFTTLHDLVIPSGTASGEAEIIHGLFVESEILSDNATGEANQRYSLNYAPALIDSDYFSVAVNSLELNDLSGQWNRVNTFAGSNSTSKVYMVENNDYGETSILFGDGNFGAKPDRCSITCSYFVGGGNRGNVGLGAINVLESNIAGVASTSNVHTISKGYDAETLEEIKVNAPTAYRNIWGALTCKDYAGTLKVHFPEVLDSEAKKSTEDWNTPEVDDIEIFILTQYEVDYAKEQGLLTIPDVWYANNDLYDSIISNIEKFFDSDTDYLEIGSNTILDTGRKLVGTRDIILKHPDFQGLNIEYSLMVKDYYDTDTVSEQIENYLKNLFKVGNIKFNEDISMQEIMYSILNESGIEGIRYLNLTLLGEKDDKGEIHNDYYSFVNGDLLVPKIGTIFVLTGLTKKILRSPTMNKGGITVV